MIAKWICGAADGRTGVGILHGAGRRGAAASRRQGGGLSGPAGLKVWTLRIGEAAAGEALLQVEGLDHDWDRLIHKVKVEKSARDSRYSTELNGSKYVILIVRDGWGELYLPGEQQTRQVAYSESLSSAGEPQAFLTDYLEQK